MDEMYRSFLGLLVLLAVLVNSGAGLSETIEDRMKDDMDLSQYYNLMETSKLAKVNLQLKPVTIFAPLNSAFQKFKTTGTEETEAMVLYHITSVPKTIAQLGSSYTSLNSEIAGNPPLWITHVNGKVQDELYVNNAMILVNQSNIQAASPYGNQVLHKIDEILIPTRSSASSYNAIYNPTAWEFLENYESLINQSPHRVRNFRQKVQKNNKQDVFNIEGGHTFFIPIDEGFANNRANLIDDKIIDGHVIPRHVLFTRPTRKDFPFETSASRDNIKVVVSFTQEQEGSAKTDYVKSHTLFGDGKHAPGVVLAEIVRPNIPVKNGVIHLIQKPLMVVDSNVKQLLEEKDGHILSRFMQVIKDQGPPGEEFLRTLERTRDVTLFAPSNNALEGDLTLNVIMSDKKKFMDILKMHLVVDDRLYVEKILKNSRTGVNQAPTSHRGKYLYFNVMASEHNRTLTVEGGGVNATVIQPDIAATNGIIHVIDRVLGVPYATVLEKIKMDPLLKTSYALGGLRHFNNQLNDTTKKFTYFIPSDKAWFGSNVASPLAVRKLFLAEYAEQATRTLERHLVISDEPYTMERIKQLTLETHTLGTFGQKHEIELPTKAGPLKLLVEERADNTFIIIWKGEQIPVLRANVECTNGIIHIIDVPFVKVGDLPVGGAATPPVGALLLLMLSALVPALTIVL